MHEYVYAYTHTECTEKRQLQPLEQPSQVATSSCGKKFTYKIFSHGLNVGWRGIKAT